MNDANEPWVCSCCGQLHTELPINFAVDFPDMYADLSTDDRISRAELSSDQCVIDEEIFAVRGLIEIPIVATDLVFLWGAWARVHPADFLDIDDSWTEEGRELTRGPFKGRLMNKLSPFDALDLKLTLKIQPVGTRPLFYIDEPHRLATQQQNGMSIEEARALSATLMHAFDGTLPVN